MRRQSGRKKTDRVGDFGGWRKSPVRNVFQQVFGQARFALELRLNHIGQHKAGRDAVTVDPVAAVGPGQRLGKRNHGTFRGCIGPVIRIVATKSSTAGDVHDGTANAGFQPVFAGG